MSSFSQFRVDKYRKMVVSPSFQNNVPLVSLHVSSAKLKKSLLQKVTNCLTFLHVTIKAVFWGFKNSFNLFWRLVCGKDITSKVFLYICHRIHHMKSLKGWSQSELYFNRMRRTEHTFINL